MALSRDEFCSQAVRNKRTCIYLLQVKQLKLYVLLVIYTVCKLHSLECKSFETTVYFVCYIAYQIPALNKGTRLLSAEHVHSRGLQAGH